MDLRGITMNNFNDINQKEWNEAYQRGGNITFYPNEEVVRFINRYIKKRRGISDFENILDIDEKKWQQFKSLDLGCGIGRHIKIMDEFHLKPYGIDLSETAISYGKKWFDEMNRRDVSERMVVGSVAELPYVDEFFDICVSESVLDSMPREIARKGVKETHRVLKGHGIFFLSLIMNSECHDEEVIVDDGYEKNTIQSYFSEDGIKHFLEGYFEIVDLKIVSTEDMFIQAANVNRLDENLTLKRKKDNLVSLSKRAYIVAKKIY